MDIVALGFVKVVAFDVPRFVKLILLVPLAAAAFIVVIGIAFVIPLVGMPALPTANALRVPFPMPFTAIIIDVATMIDKYV